MESGNREEMAVEGEDSQSQLSLASQSSQVEPSVVLSSPTDDSETANLDQNKEEPLKSGVEIDDDDSVFMEGTTTTSASDGDKGIDIDSSERDTAAECRMEDKVVIATERALERACPSPPMSVRSPEIPLQSSPSRTDPPLNPPLTECGQSVRDSVSSEESEDMKMETEQEGRVVASTDSIVQSQQRNTLDHDHPYHLLSQQKEPCNDENQSTSTSSNATSATLPVVTSTSAELADHSYCSINQPQQATSVMSAAVQPLETDSDQTVADLRSKLSSDVQDHNYCRLPSPDHSQTAAGETSEALVYTAEITRNNDSENISESQELFSVSEHDEQLNVGDNERPVRTDQSVTSTDVGCQTESVELPPSTTLHTPANTSMADTLRSAIDSMLAQDNLPTSTLWKVHQELVRGLSVVSERLSSDRF